MAEEVASSSEAASRAVESVNGGEGSASSTCNPDGVNGVAMAKDRTEETGSPKGAAAVVPSDNAATTTDNNTITIQVKSSTIPPPGGDETDGGVKSAPKSSSKVAVTRIEINGSNIRESMEADRDRDHETSRSQSRLGAEEEDDDDDDASDISSVINAPSVISQAPDRYGFLGGEQYTHERFEKLKIVWNFYFHVYVELSGVQFKF